MYKSLKIFRERFYSVPIIKRNLITDQSKLNNVNSDRIFTIQNIEEFNEKLMNSDSPVIVNFSAIWCFNCTLLSPLIESIVREHSSKIKLFKVDVDKHMDLAMAYNVSTVPVMFGVNRGEIQSSLTGLHDIKKIQIWLENFLSKT